MIIFYLDAPRHVLFLPVGNPLKHRLLFIRCRHDGSS